MDEETKTRGRGRPTNVEVFGDAAGDPLAQLMARIRALLVREGRVKPGMRVTVGAGGVRRTVAAAGSTVRISPTRRVVVAPKPADDRPAPVRGKGRTKPQKPPHLRTTREVVHHAWSTREVVEMREAPRKNLKRWGYADGDHIDRFIADYETCGADLRSRGFDVGSGGGGGIPFPVRKVDAARRLHDLLVHLGGGDFDLVTAVLIHGATPTSLHCAGGEEHVVARREIRDALDRMAVFYTPGRVMRKRTWDAATKLIQEAERKASK